MNCFNILSFEVRVGIFRMDFEIVFAKEVTSLYGLFEGCRLSALPKNLDTSRITDMSRMFARTEIKTPFPELDTGNAVKIPIS